MYSKHVPKFTLPDTTVSPKNWLWMFAALMAHTSWGLYPVLGRYMQTVSHLPSMLLLVISNLPLALLFAFRVLPYTGWSILQNRTLHWLAIVVAARSITNILSQRYTLAIYVQLITLLTPFLVVFLNRWFLQEPLPRFTGVAITLSLLGSLLVFANQPGAGFQLRLTHSDWLGIALAILSTFCLAFYMITVRYTSRLTFSSLEVLAVHGASVLSVSLLLSLGFGEDWMQWRAISAFDWGIVLTYVFVVILGANGLQIASIRHLGAATVSSTMSWRLVSTLIFAWLLLGESLTTWVQVIGAGLVLGVVSYYLWQQRQ
jgi:drug/metabolite transporter (DMT)-like permease